MTRTTTTLAMLAALAALGPAAQAAVPPSLTLSGTDSVTVNAAGTVGTINNTPTVNPNTSYAGAPAVSLSGASTFTLGAGGTINGTSAGNNALQDGSTGAVTITGGILSNPNGGGTVINAFGSGSVTITGGTFTGGYGGSAVSAQNGLVSIAGGTFTSPGGNTLFCSSPGFGVIDLFGTGFSYTVNGVTTPITSGPLPTASGIGINGTLSGTLLNGDPLNNTTFLNRATIEVNVGTPPTLPASAPEPSQFAAFAIGLLGLGALALKARRRSIA